VRVLRRERKRADNMTGNGLNPLEFYGEVVGTIGLVVAIIALIRSLYVPNKLELSLLDPPFEDVIDYSATQHTTSRFSHIVVKNNHKRTMAKNCKAYLIGMKETGGKELVNTPIPLKWRGFPTLIMDIAPNGEERFDAFHIEFGNLTPISFNSYVDSTALIPIAKFPGKYEVTYRVTSGNFKPKERAFTVNLSVNATEVYIK